MDDAKKQPAENTYIFDSEKSEEMARLMMMDQITTKAMGGALAGLPALRKKANVIDLACGPGSWVLDVAYLRSDIEVCGVDISRGMVDYANARASSQKRYNASFGVMDVTKKLDFADNTFDLVNARFLTTVIPRDSWPTFLQECMRILRPGGILRITESEHIGLTNSAACEQIRLLACQLVHATNHGFSPDGQSFGITPIVGRLLRKAGLQGLQQNTHMVDFSAGTDAWLDFYHNMEIAFALGSSTAERLGLKPPPDMENPDHLLRQALADIRREDFCCLWWFLSSWGNKPNT